MTHKPVLRVPLPTLIVALAFCALCWALTWRAVAEAAQLFKEVMK